MLAAGDRVVVVATREGLSRLLAVASAEYLRSGAVAAGGAPSRGRLPTGTLQPER